MDAETKAEFDKLLSTADNDKCIDCNTVHPKWASVNNGCFLCIDCAGTHRNMGVHISFVRSITLDAWPHTQLSRMEHGGNQKLKQFWEVQQFSQHKDLTPKQRLDNEAMDKYRSNLLKLAKNEDITDIPFIGYKAREIIVKNNKEMKGMGNTSYVPPNHRSRHLIKRRSKILRYGLKATLAITRTPVTDEPEEITLSKLQLKEGKHWSFEIEEIVRNLYLAQNNYAQINKLFNSTIAAQFNQHAKTDKFSLFLNNIGQTIKSLEECYEIYLMEMEDELIKPLHAFNKKEFEKCQKLKLKLKNTKGQYDMVVKNENEDTFDEKSINKLNELQLARNDFILSVRKMQSVQQTELLSSIKSYFQSFEAFSKTQAQIFDENKHKMMDDGKKCDCGDERRETHVVIKQGWMRKRGGGNKSSKFKKRYFKLFTDKKLAYYTKERNCRAKGHANLSFIQIKKMEDTSFTIQTSKRLWVFQCDTREERDDWVHVIEIKCIKDKNNQLIPYPSYDVDDVFGTSDDCDDDSYNCL